jgi:hypothetical protein
VAVEKVSAVLAVIIACKPSVRARRAKGLLECGSGLAIGTALAACMGIACCNGESWLLWHVCKEMVCVIGQDCCQ